MKFSQRLAIRYFRAKFKFLSSISKKKAARQAFTLFCTPLHRHRKPLPKIFGEADKLQITLRGLSVTGWRWNHPSNKKIMIIHGFESSVTNFERYIRPFISKGYEVLAFDAPAHGRSGGRQITAPLYKEMIVAVNTRYGPITSFMAHSFGGLAVCLALEEIPHTATTKLALIAPATETTTAIDSFFRFLRIEADVRNVFDRLIVDIGGHPASWYSIRRALKQINARLLWIHDKDDDTTPLADAKELISENPEQVQSVITEGLGHRRIYRDNNVAKAIVDFL